jgi:hypothetical protein
MPDTQYLTRDELHALLRECGFPIGRGTLDKLCAPSCGEGPPVAATWPGRRYDRPLYDPAAAIAWAENRLKPAIAQAA